MLARSFSRMGDEMDGIKPPFVPAGSLRGPGIPSKTRTRQHRCLPGQGGDCVYVCVCVGMCVCVYVFTYRIRVAQRAVYVQRLRAARAHNDAAVVPADRRPAHVRAAAGDAVRRVDVVGGRVQKHPRVVGNAVVDGKRVRVGEGRSAAVLVELEGAG
jgi:hypothetical protein